MQNLLKMQMLSSAPQDQMSRQGRSLQQLFRLHCLTHTGHCCKGGTVCPEHGQRLVLSVEAPVHYDIKIDGLLAVMPTFKIQLLHIIAHYFTLPLIS